MRLHCEHNFLRPILHANSRWWSFHFQRNRHRPTKLGLLPYQNEHTLRHFWQKDNQVHDKRLSHHLYPKSHHKRFPRRHCEVLLPFLQRSSFLQPVSNLTEIELWTNLLLVSTFRHECQIRENISFDASSSHISLNNCCMSQHAYVEIWSWSTWEVWKAWKRRRSCSRRSREQL